MTQPAIAQQNTPAQLLFGAALSAGTGAVAAALFTTIGPVGGAIFGVSSFLSGRLVHFIFDKVDCFPESNVAKIAKFVLSSLGGIAAGALIATAVGVPLTFTAGLILTLGMGVVTLTSLLVIGGCMCSSAVATGIALGRDDRGVSVRV
jgi:hypothetical protein